MISQMDSGEKKSPAPLQFFLYVVNFVALFFVAMGTGAIVFQLINKAFPDPVRVAVEGVYSQEAVKFGIAAILVAFPLFLFLMKTIFKQLKNGMIECDSRVRKWVTYIVLFINAVIMIGDLISVIFSFLNGDIAVRFALQMLTILVISGSIFSFFYWDIRKKKTEHVNYPFDGFIGIAAVVVIVGFFISGFFIIDKPSVSRAKRIDQETTNDLRNVDSAVRGYYIQTGNLPDSLDGLSKTEYAVGQIHPESKLEYRKTSSNTFVLCANFLRNNSQDFVSAQGIPGNEWEHDTGKVCFDRIALRSPDASQKPIGK